MLGRYLGTCDPSVVSSSSMWGVDPLANHDMGPRAYAMVGYTSGGFGDLIRYSPPPLLTYGLCISTWADQAG